MHICIKKFLTCGLLLVSSQVFSSELSKKLKTMSFDSLEPLVTEHIQQQIIELDETNTEALFKLGKTLQAYEFFEQAINCYLKVIELSPQKFDAQYLLAKSYLQANMLENAIDAFESALKIDSTYLPAHTSLIESAINLEQLGFAQTKLSSLPEGLLNTPTILMLQGDIYQLQKQHQKAIEFYYQALLLQPQASRLYYKIAMSQRALDLRNEARESLKLSGKVGVKPADPIFTEIADLAKGERINLLKGKSAFSMGQYQKAQQYFADAIKSEPKSARARVNLSATLVQLGQMDEAKNVLLEALTLDPNNTTAHYNLAELLYFSQNFELAKTHYLLVLKDAPNDLPANFALAKTFIQLNEISQGEQYIEKANIFSPLKTSLLFELVELFYTKRAYKQAVALMERALVIAPENAIVALNYANLLQALSGGFYADDDKAIMLYERIMKSNSSFDIASRLTQAYLNGYYCQKAADLMMQLDNLAQQQKTDISQYKQSTLAQLNQLQQFAVCK